MNDEIFLCKSVTEDVPSCRWVVSLSNGETIFEDRKSGLVPAWERLAHYVEQKNLTITRMRLQLGHLEVTLPSHAEGYVQKKKVMSTGSWSKEQYCVGHIEGKLARINYVASDRSSETLIEADPGPPYTIYNRR